MASAGHTPILVDANGAATNASPAAGIRFYRTNPQSSYKIAYAPTNSDNRDMLIQLAPGQSLPKSKDVFTIATIGYQGIVSYTFPYIGYTDVKFTNIVSSDCSPPPSSVIDLGNPQQYAQSWSQVAFIVVGNQLRYYPQSLSVATDTAAVFNNPANYQVLVNLVSSANASNGNAATPLLPFSIVNPPTVTVQLYAENPDYNNRTSAGSNSINSADTYTYMQCSLGARSPVLLRSPY